MGYSSVREAEAFKTALNSYALATGQQVNWDKSTIYFMNTLVLRQQKIAKIIGCKVDMVPSTYLGLPLGLTPPNSFWNMIIDKFNKKLAGWKGSILSQAGKLQLLQATLQNLPVYALSLFGICWHYVNRYADIMTLCVVIDVNMMKRREPI